MLKRTLKVLLYLLLIVTGVVFAVSNRGKVDVTLFPLPYAISLPLFVLAVASAFIGMLVGWFLTRIKMFRIIKAAKDAQEHAMALQGEIAAMRSEKLIRPR